MVPFQKIGGVAALERGDHQRPDQRGKIPPKRNATQRRLARWIRSMIRIMAIAQNSESR
jgi:hypothetical protein